jgi:23S rRNA pseudouridine1911/1915/1917 synthase
VVGDPVYRPRKLSGVINDKLSSQPPSIIAALKSADRQLLHAWQLGLTHPHSGKYMTFEAPLPADMQALLVALRRSG